MLGVCLNIHTAGTATSADQLEKFIVADSFSLHSATTARLLLSQPVFFFFWQTAGNCVWLVQKQADPLVQQLFLVDQGFLKRRQFSS